jgi:hypothetical protein
MQHCKLRVIETIPALSAQVGSPIPSLFAQPAYVERPAVQDAFQSNLPHEDGAVICPAFMCGS